jgi:hypothetical protein
MGLYLGFFRNYVTRKYFFLVSLTEKEISSDWFVTVKTERKVKQIKKINATITSSEIKIFRNGAERHLDSSFFTLHSDSGLVVA